MSYEDMLRCDTAYSIKNGTGGQKKKDQEVKGGMTKTAAGSIMGGELTKNFERMF